MDKTWRTIRQSLRRLLRTRAARSHYRVLRGELPELRTWAAPHLVASFLSRRTARLERRKEVLLGDREHAHDGGACKEDDQVLARAMEMPHELAYCGVGSERGFDDGRGADGNAAHPTDQCGCFIRESRLEQHHAGTAEVRRVSRAHASSSVRWPAGVRLTRWVASRPHSRPGASPVRRSKTNPCIGQMTE